MIRKRQNDLIVANQTFTGSAVGDEFHGQRKDVPVLVSGDRTFADELVLVYVVGDLHQLVVGGDGAEVRQHFHIGIILVFDLFYDNVVEDSLDFELDVRVLVQGRGIAFVFEVGENVVPDGLSVGMPASSRSRVSVNFFISGC